MPQSRTSRGIAVAITLLLTPVGQAAAADLPGVCMREGAKLAGMAPVQAGKGVRQPRKIHNVVPKYPDLPPGTTLRLGPFLGELLMDLQGLVKGGLDHS